MCSVDGSPATALSSQLRHAERFLGVAADHERVQRVGGVAQPAVAIVPIPHAPDLLRQRRRRRGNDAAGGCKRQRLERDERAHHLISPGPSYLQRAHQARHQRSVSLSAAIPSNGSGEEVCEGCHISRNGIRSPSRTTNVSAGREVLSVSLHLRSKAKQHRDRQSHADDHPGSEPRGRRTRSRTG